MQSVGDILRAERLKKGMTIKDVENTTHIRTVYLTAIEEGRFDAIPGEVYIKGFIRNYASCVGLDPEQMVAAYRANRYGISELKDPDMAESKPRERRKKSSTGLWTIAFLLFLVLAGFGTYWWINAKKPPASLPPPPSTTQNPAAPAPPPAPPQPAPQAGPQTPPPTTVAVKPLTLNARFTDRCWVMVTADGKVIYENTVKAGDAFVWEAKHSMSVKLGNAAAAELILDGQPVGKLGDRGEVVIKTFTR